MPGSLAERWRLLRTDPHWRDWVPAGVLGACVGGSAAAWLLWGTPNLLGGAVCFPLLAPLLLMAYLFAAAMAISLAMLVQRAAKLVRQLRVPAAVARWEPAEPMVELELLSWPWPGCGAAIYVPLILLTGLGSFILLYLGCSQIRLWRLLVTTVICAPVALALARREARAWRRSEARGT